MMLAKEKGKGVGIEVVRDGGGREGWEGGVGI